MPQSTLSAVNHTTPASCKYIIPYTHFILEFYNGLITHTPLSLVATLVFVGICHTLYLFQGSLMPDLLAELASALGVLSPSCQDLTSKSGLSWSLLTGSAALMLGAAVCSMLLVMGKHLQDDG